MEEKKNPESNTPPQQSGRDNDRPAKGPNPQGERSNRGRHPYVPRQGGSYNKEQGERQPKPQETAPAEKPEVKQESSSDKANVSNTPKKVPYSRYRRKQYVPHTKEGGNIAPRRTTFKKVSIVVPLFNEEESLHPLANEIKKAMKAVSVDYEVMLVDDGSTDKSLKIIKEIARTDPKFKYISFRKNYGKSAALQMGFKQISGDVIVTMDADLQDDPNEIPNLLQKLEEGYDLVSGWKKQRFDPFVKRQSSKFFNFVTGLLSGVKIHDFNCGLKAYRKDVVKDIKVYGELHRYMPVMADWQGYRIGEIVVKHHPRRYGTTKFGISRFFKGFIDLLTVMFTTRYIKRPMHLFGFLGAISFIIGFFVNGFLAYEKIFLNKSLSNRPLLSLGMLLIIVGVQFFSVGLLGEIIVHNSQNEKEYSIKDKG